MPSSLTEGRPSTSVCSTSPPVSVCGTGGTALARGFSRQCGFNPCERGSPPALPITSRSAPRRICLPRLPTGLEGAAAPPGLPPCVPPSLITDRTGTGLVTRCPSPTAPALGLGPPHPQLISMAAEPSGIRWGGFAPPSRYSCRHSHSPPLQGGFHRPFAADGDAPLPCGQAASAASVPDLAPVDCRCRGTRPVSSYALFQGWLLLSQPPGCLGPATPLPT